MKHESYVGLLLANITHQPISGILNTILHHCVGFRHYVVYSKDVLLESLLKVPGINVNIKNNNGDTAAHIDLTVNGSHASLHCFLNHSEFDPDILNNNGESILDIAMKQQVPPS